MKVLVVGATGQVGSEVVRQLDAGGHAVRAFVRRGSAYQHLEGIDGIELCFGDLLDPDTIPVAVAGVDAVVATANSVAPRRRREFGRVESAGYPVLIDAAEQAGVGRFVYLSSVPSGEMDDRLPMSRHKRAVEATLQASGVPHTIMRFSAFTDVWLALVGSEIPTSSTSPTLFDRPFWFLRIYRRLTGRTIDRFGRLVVVGSPDRRVAFITVGDAAAFLVAALDQQRPQAELLEIGGPEAVSWRQVAALYGGLLERQVTIVSLPPTLFGVLGRLLAPVAPAAANILTVNYLEASADSSATGTRRAEEFGVAPLERVETFLQARMAPTT